MGNQNDDDFEVLLASAKSGDEDAIGRLLDSYRDYLTLRAQGEIGPALRKRVDAEDIVQSVFASASRAFHEFNGTEKGQFFAWLHGILRHHVFNLVRDHRAAKRDVGREDTWGRVGADVGIYWIEAQRAETPSMVFVKGERALELSRALNALPEDQREAVRLKHLEGWSIADIAEHLGKTQPAVAGLLRRGIAALRDCIR